MNDRNRSVADHVGDCLGDLVATAAPIANAQEGIPALTDEQNHFCDQVNLSHIERLKALLVEIGEYIAD